MEQKSVLLSALGVGVGLGIGLVSGQSFERWANLSGSEEAELIEKYIEQELKRQISKINNSRSFDEFPYILSKRTRELLTSTADAQLKGYNISKHTRNLAPASKIILLSGHGEGYHYMLAMALSHYSESNLLLLDIPWFSLGLQTRYGCTKREPLYKRSISELTLDKMSSLMAMFSQSEVKPRGTLHQHTSGTHLKSRNEESSNSPPTHKRNASASSDIFTNLCFDEKIFLESLYKVVVSVSKTVPLIIYFKDIEKLLESERFYKLFQRFLKKLSGPVLILGSKIFEPKDDCHEVVGEGISTLFPYTIEIIPPKDEIDWKSQLEVGKKFFQYLYNKKHIAEVLAANDIQCDDLDSIGEKCSLNSLCWSDHIEEIVVSAISYHMIHTKEPEYRDGKLVISSESLSHGLSMFGGNESLEDSSPGPEPDNEYEKLLRSQVIAADEIGVTFADIGSLEGTKESLQELVILPLQRPHLFQGGLLKPCKGILLFGPPGTGKTMLAKAIANEAGASFINISIATITTKSFGESEKNVKAIFTLAAKVSPAIIFVDEVDDMLGKRKSSGESEAMRRMKNEFMTQWDGLMTKSSERILVLAATNRPFDLDEAVIRRFERRIMVGLPSIESREKILRTLLSKEKTDNLDFQELGLMTEGYTGSDLKNLCITAAYRPLRELIERERLRDQERKKKEEARKSTEESKEVGKSTEEASASEESVITLRPLNMEDMRKAKIQVGASYASEGEGMKELKEWNDLYGEEGSRKKKHLTHYI